MNRCSLRQKSGRSVGQDLFSGLGCCLFRLLELFLSGLLLLFLALIQPTGDRLTHVLHEGGNGLGCIVISWDRKLHLKWIRVRVDNGENGY